MDGKKERTRERDVIMRVQKKNKYANKINNK